MPHNFEPWCAQHQSHPEDCWLEHNPPPTSRAETPEELATRTAKEHLEWQAQGGKPKEEANANISDG